MFLTVVGSCLLGLALVGCAPEQPEKVVLRGSNTVGEELAPGLVAEYRKQHPGAAFDGQYKGTSYGLGALMVGQCDIAAASRPVTTNEFEMARERGIELVNYLIGSYSVAVIVNGGNAVTTLTPDQIRDLFTGVTRNWKEVGGADAPVHLYGRDPVSGTYLGFRELAMENKPYALGLKTYTNYTELVSAVAQDPNGLGYASFALATKPGIKALSVGGVAPTADAVNQGKYPFARALHLFTNKGTEPPLAHSFIEFVQSARGQQVLAEMGYVPHP